MAVILALFLKVFVVEAYKIPTGSMQPTLIGDADTGIQDRILVDKLSYQVRPPARFEVVVFRFPLDRGKTFVKRVVGVGPEDFESLCRVLKPSGVGSIPTHSRHFFFQRREDAGHAAKNKLDTACLAGQQRREPVLV